MAADNSPYIFDVNGRKAIPVRAIPYMTNWDVSPDMVARWLAWKDNSQILLKSTAFHLIDCVPSEIHPTRWDAVIDDMGRLSSSLAEEYGGDEVGRVKRRPDWLRQSPKLLLPVFMWVDDLELAWTYISNQEHYVFTHGGLVKDGRPRGLDFSPFIAPEMRIVVLEGMPTAFGGASTRDIRPFPGGVLRADEAEELKHGQMNYLDTDPPRQKERALGADIQERHDALALELDELIRAMESNGERVTGNTVMRKLVLRVGVKGTCITSETAEGVKWDNGKSERSLSVSQLQARIHRWYAKQKRTKQHTLSIR